jgi:GDP-D-mannose dehydratase
MHVEDAVDAVYLLMTQGAPDDYIVSSGITRCLKDVLLHAFELYGKTLVEKEGTYVDETGVVWVQACPANHLERSFTDSASVAGYASDAGIGAYGEIRIPHYSPYKLNAMGWKPRYTLDELLERMV